MTANHSSLLQWQFGPLRLWLQAHARGERGEAQARALLGAALGEGNVHIERDGRGRPRLCGPSAHLDANWSHSGDWLLVALGEGVQVGADLEWLRPRPRAMEIAARFFDPAEAGWLRGLPEPLRESTFVRVWCAKEAILKAHGHGISFGLEKLRLAMAGDRLYLHDCDRRLGRPGDWLLHEWEPLPGYRAVVAWRAWPSAIMGG